MARTTKSTGSKSKSRRTLQDINNEIAKLQAEANAVRESEKSEVIARIKEAVAFYGITAADFGLSGKRSGGKRKAGATGSSDGSKSKSNAESRVKYKDDAGNTWSGFGRKPKWIVDALAGGKTLEALLA